MRTEHLRGVLSRLLPDGLTDGQLLTRFIDGREEAAFAAIVRRHGPMVLGVCRRVLGHAHDAEDAFQATFLVFARKAASVARREALGAFLYGVAYRTALAARRRAVRRRAVETEVDEMPHPEVPPAEPQDWRPVLDRELNLLPEKLRSVLLLCDLGGKTRREAARQLGVPEGTVATRLASARRMLARRLVRCGVVLSGGALAAALAGGASAAVPGPLASATVKAAALVAAGQAAATPAAALMNEVLRSMLMTKLKTYAGVVLAAALVGIGGVAYRASGQNSAPAGRVGQAVAPPPAPRPERPTELELLRREVDILKERVSLLEDRQRAQEAERRASRGRPGAGFGAPGTMRRGMMAPGGPIRQEGNSGMAPMGRNRYQQESGSSTQGAAGPLPTQEGRAAPSAGSGQSPSGQPRPGTGAAPQGQPAGAVAEGGYAGGQRSGAGALDAMIRGMTGAGGKRPGGPPPGASPDEEIDAAVKAIREARDEDAKRRAVDALEKALKELRQQRKGI